MALQGKGNEENSSMHMRELTQKHAPETAIIHTCKLSFVEIGSHLARTSYYRTHYHIRVGVLSYLHPSRAMDLGAAPCVDTNDFQVSAERQAGLEEG